MPQHNKYKRFKLSLAGLLLMNLLSDAQAENVSSDSHSLTVMGFNIWDKGSKSRMFDTDEAESGNFIYNQTTQNLLIGVAPDVIVMPELYNKNRSDEHIYNTLTLLNSIPGKPGDYRKPEGRGEIIAGGTFEEIETNRLLMKNRNGFPDVFIEGLHLASSDDPTLVRLKEAQNLVKSAQERQFPTILVGDFNAGDLSERGLNSVDAQIRLMKSNNRALDEQKSLYGKLCREYLANGDETKVREIVSAAYPEENIDKLKWKQWGEALEAAWDRGEDTGLRDETYPVYSNTPRTLNVLKKQFQLMQLERNREQFHPGKVGDGRATWTSDGEETTNIWPGWDRANIDHIMVSRPFAKWTEIVDNGIYSGTLSQASKLPDGHSLSDHEPVAQQLRWIGPLLESYSDNEADKVRLVWGADAYDFFGRNREFYLTRNNMRDDLYLGQVSDENGLPVLTNLTSEEKKTLLDCRSADPRFQQAISDYCLDDHSFIGEIVVKDEGTLIVDEDAAMGGKDAGLRLVNGGLRISGTDMKHLDREVNIYRNGWFDIADANNTVSVAQKISGEGTLIKRGAGTLVLDAANSYTGGTVVDEGTLRAGNQEALPQNSHFTVNNGELDLNGFDLNILSLAGEGGRIRIDDASLNIIQEENTYFNGDLKGTGKLQISGKGSLTLNGDNHIGAGTTLSGGTLIIGDAAHKNAELRGTLNLENNSLLSGSGSTDSLFIGNGSHIAPGNSVGNLNINGDLTLAPYATYDVEITPTLSDRLDVTGKAALGDASLSVEMDPSGKYLFGTRYTILTANQGIDGVFGHHNLPSLNMPFVRLNVAYSPESVYLDVTRNDIQFEQVAFTDNQRSVARGVGTLSTANRIYGAVASQETEHDAREAFNALSGESYASIGTALINNSTIIRNVIFDRLNTQSDPSSPDGMWGATISSWSRTTSGREAATLKTRYTGLSFGYDNTEPDNWRFGALAAYSRADISINDRHTSAAGDQWHLGIYGSTEMQDTMMKAGLAWSWHQLDTDRKVLFPDFSESLHSDLNAQTAQVFGELSHSFSFWHSGLEPFARFAVAEVKTGSFHEKNGNAALKVKKSSSSTTFNTLGLRLSSFVRKNSVDTSLNAMAGWQHISNDRHPETKARLSGGEYFKNTGVSVPKNSVLLNAGVDINISNQAVLGIYWSGQYSADFHQNSCTAKLSIPF